MKKLILALSAALLVAGCQQEANQSSEKKADSKTAVESKAASVELAEKDKIAYAIGSNMAETIVRINEDFKALEMDISVVERGFKDTLAKNSKLTAEEINQQLQIFQGKMRFAQQQKMEEAKAKLKADNEAYLAENLTKGFTQTESGLQYKVLTPAAAEAAKPSATDSVKVHYTGTFTDGKKFDSSVDKGQPFEFSLKGGVIQGWLEGVKLMSVGSKYQFVIPPELGYGFGNSGRIPGGSILVFDVELLEIVPPKTPANQEN